MTVREEQSKPTATQDLTWDKLGNPSRLVVIWCAHWAEQLSLDSESGVLAAMPTQYHVMASIRLTRLASVLTLRWTCPGTHALERLSVMACLPHYTSTCKTAFRKSYTFL